MNVQTCLCEVCGGYIAYLQPEGCARSSENRAYQEAAIKVCREIADHSILDDDNLFEFALEMQRRAVLVIRALERCECRNQEEDMNRPREVRALPECSSPLSHITPHRFPCGCVGIPIEAPVLRGKNLWQKILALTACDTSPEDDQGFTALTREVHWRANGEGGTPATLTPEEVEKLATGVRMQLLDGHHLRQIRLLLK